MSEDPRNVCSPCRGTGMLKSNQGGALHAVTCPWCGGSGRFVAGRDAQAGKLHAPDAGSGEAKPTA